MLQIMVQHVLMVAGFQLSNAYSQCEKDFDLYFQSRHTELWAMKSKRHHPHHHCLQLKLVQVADAYGTGFITARLEGNHLRRGAYHSCLQVDGGSFRGQYCNVLSKLVPSSKLEDSAQQNFSPTPLALKV